MVSRGLLWSVYNFKRFYKYVLPVLDDNTAMVYILVARKKYGGVSRSEERLNFEIIKNSEYKYMLGRLRRICNVSEVYVDRNTGKFIPSSSMAVYITLARLDVRKAAQKLTQEMMQVVFSGKYSRFKNVTRMFVSALMRSPANKPYYIIDIDNNNTRALYDVLTLLDNDVVWVTKTRGGYHVIANNIQPDKRLYHKDGKVFMADNGDIHETNIPTDAVEIMYRMPVTPVPGTIQGGYTVIGSPRLDVVM